MSTQGQTADQEFLTRLDEAIGCQQCGGPLGQSVSDDFCRPSCQQAWFAQHAEPLPATVDPWHTWADSHPYGDDTLPTGQTAERYEGDAPVPAVRTGFDLSAGYMGLNEVRRLLFPEGNHSVNLGPRPWRLPRSTGNLFRDQNALVVAELGATTDAQRAACAVRREDLEARGRSDSAPSTGRRARWGFDSFLLSPIEPIVGATSFGRRFAESFAAGMAAGHRSVVRSNVSWPVIDLEFSTHTRTESRERVMHERTQGNFSIPPQPAIVEGDTIRVHLQNGSEWRGVVTNIGPGDGQYSSRMECRRADLETSSPVPRSEDWQAVLPPGGLDIRSGDWTIQGAAEATLIATENPPAGAVPDSPQARALEARRNRNTGPATRPGRTSGNVPGARR